MLYSRLSKYISPDPESRVIRLITWFIRELTALVFIFSGFVKAVDPWGTLYKTEDYLSAMGLSIWPNLVIVGVFFLCGIEFLIGICVATGCFRRGSAVMAFALMCFMMPLSLWIAVFNPVADCGCFGDALVISNWATFWKNVVLILLTYWLLRYNRYCRTLITPSLQWIELIASAAFIFIIEIIGYVYQPLIDFRKYTIGKPLTEQADSDNEPEYSFIYSKEGKQKEFSIDSLPDESEGWTFVDRKEIKRADNTDSDGFHIWKNDIDVTDSVLTDDRDRLLLLMPDLAKVSISTTWKINSLKDWASRNNIDMIAVAAGNPDDLSNWEDLSMPDYPIYLADDTAIKELARGNPAVVFTRNGIISWKSSLRAINTDDFLAGDTSKDPMSFSADNHRILYNFSMIYVAVTVLLIMISIIPFWIKKIWK